MPRSLKILHVLHCFSPGGLENGVVNLINRSPDHYVHELCFIREGGEFLQRLERPVTYHELRKPPGNDIGIIFRLWRLFRQRNIDVIHTNNWAAFDAVLAACLTTRPVVIHTEHGHGTTNSDGQIRRRNLTRRATAFRATKFVAVSRDLYGWLRSTVRVPERKLSLIPNGVDTDRFRPGRDLGLRRSLGIADDEFVVGIVGRLDPIKNHKGLIGAIRSVNSAGHKVRLVIAGDGPEREAIEKLLHSHPGPEPLLLGNRADIDRLYRVFDLFVLNSFDEGMSYALLEAMASGLPSVCTAVGGNPDLVSDRERGILIRAGSESALAEAICEYVNSPEMGQTHGSQARRFVVEHFSLEKMINQYAALYESGA
jgi:sugar transferase (PEP-CTERM/EpsH1 system associated)